MLPGAGTGFVCPDGAALEGREMAEMAALLGEGPRCTPEARF